MADFEGDLNLYISNLQEFYASAIEMLDNHILMGQFIETLYSNSAMKNYSKEIKQILSDQRKIKLKLESTTSQIVNLCEGSKEQLKILKQKQKVHYDTRILFDYYRNKMASFDKANTNQDPKKKERYDKNVPK